MSGPEGTGARRPLRSAGWTMLGLAVAAALVGLVLLVTGGAEPPADGSSAAASDPAPENASATPSPAPSPPMVTTATGIPTVTSEPGPTTLGPIAAAPPGSGASPSRPARGETRVYNNSTITGLAARAANDLDAAGWTVVEVDNYRGLIPTTTVYYQEGTDQRRIAEAIGAEFGMRVEPRFVGIEDAKPGVIVIVTNDYGS